jgi:hypothetical protein
MNEKYDQYVEKCFRKSPKKMKWGDPIFVEFKDIVQGVQLHFDKDIDAQGIFLAIDGEVNGEVPDDLWDIYMAAFDFSIAVGRKVAADIVQNMSDHEFGKFEADNYSDEEGNFDCSFDLEWQKTGDNEYKARLYPEYPE